jgi:hypothetical protein
LLFVTIVAVVNNWFGPPALMLLSTAATFYFLFQVPNWCCTINRDGINDGALSPSWRACSAVVDRPVVSECSDVVREGRLQSR